MSEVNERLREYYPFSDSVVDRVAEVAERQQDFSNYGDMFNFVGVDEATNAEILDIKPASGYDTEKVLIVHLPMANSLDTNQLFQVASLSMMFPNDRIVAAANPSGFGYGHNLLHRQSRSAVSRGDFFPVVKGLVRYLESDGVGSAVQVGGSYGVDLALATTKTDAFDVKKQLLIEPASVVSKSLSRLAKDFVSTDKELSRYVEANDLEIFSDARKEAVTLANYGLGLLRLSNIAVARGIALGGFETKLMNTLSGGHVKSIPETTVAWGSESELCDDNEVVEAIQFAGAFTGQDVAEIRLKGQKHALINDLYLFGALALTALDG